MSKKPEAEPVQAAEPLTPATCSEIGGHAMVQRDGYSVPLIGIPPDAVVEECDCCHDLRGLLKLTWTGKQMLCAKCAESPNAQAEARREGH